ncbi:galactose mutarotase-like enzyme [Streptohalobacillus salinus]|uniref:Galactose mutarotase-like enzyme n=1 Tax=Streptohalobacillus salinus TaxID=621096 RepID=A0A2V3WHD5_9BACI|nr:aldose epimerase [Streptohalobacillus salinus]PXW92964.1 galactose mutarotase-like enzyme [Streptohalobacillus salinus]
MYTITNFEKEMFKMYQLKSPNGESWITVCPERGGIIIEYGTKGKEKLYLNEASLFDRKRNIRGGIPVLFPIAGQLEEQAYHWEGKTYAMPNHGLARIHPWEVIETFSDETHAFISIRFESSLSTKAVYPFDFEVIFTYTLKDNQLYIHQTYRNHSETIMPIYPGLHPYFKADSKIVTVDHVKDTYHDYNTNETKPYPGKIDLTHLKEAVALENNHKHVNATVGDFDIQMTLGNAFRYTVLWTEENQSFVCVEPWTRKTGELNRKEALIEVEPKQAFETWVSFQVV